MFNVQFRYCLCSFFSSWRWICINFEIHKSNELLMSETWPDDRHWLANCADAIQNQNEHYTPIQSNVCLLLHFGKRNVVLFIRCVFGFSRRAKKKTNNKTELKSAFLLNEKQFGSFSHTHTQTRGRKKKSVFHKKKALKCM